MPTICPVVICCLKKDNKFLLTKRIHDNPDFHDRWQFPGGELEFGETPEKALLREVKEELGIDVEIKHMIPKVFTRNIGSLWQGLFICFICTVKDESQQIVINEEASDFAWYTVHEIKNLESLPLTKDILRQAI